MLLLLILLFIVFCLFYKWGIHNNNYFAEKGIEYVKPTFLLGNLTEILFKKVTPVESLTFMYNKFPNAKLYGMFDFRSPTFMIKDVDLIRKMLIEDFEYFQDHGSVINENMDPLLGNALISLKGQKWRDMRNTLSPMFTGNKLRIMSDLVCESANTLVTYLLNEYHEIDGLELETKDLFAKNTMDVIATCAFGIKINSIQEPNNKFYEIGKKLTEFTSPKQIIKYIGFNIVPELMKMLNINMLSTDEHTFFRTLIADTMQYRKKENVHRPDMIHLLMQTKSNVSESQEDESLNLNNSKTIREWSDDELTAQCILFFAAGFETTSTLLSFAAYEIAVNDIVKEKLLSEVDKIKNEIGFKPLTYEHIQKMDYLEMVINETLRKWPPLSATDRGCTKDYHLKTDDGLDIVIEKGKSIWVPIYCIHHDSKHFPDPEKFDPERFNKINKLNIVPFSYMPFGVGPRNCIGLRFALMQIKITLFYILNSFSFEVGINTQIPLKLSKTAMTMNAEDGVWVSLKPRRR